MFDCAPAQPYIQHGKNTARKDEMKLGVSVLNVKRLSQTYLKRTQPIAGFVNANVSFIKNISRRISRAPVSETSKIQFAEEGTKQERVRGLNHIDRKCSRQHIEPTSS